MNGLPFQESVENATLGRRGDPYHIQGCVRRASLIRMNRLLVLCLLLATTSVAQTSMQSQEPLGAVRNEYQRAYNLHDADLVLALYADDAVLLSESGVFRGKSEIRKWLQFAFDQGSVLETISATREQSSDTIAYGTGETKRLAGQEVHLGRYLIVLQKREARWVIVEHASFNVH